MKYMIFFILAFSITAAPPTRQTILNELNNTVIKSVSIDDLTIEELTEVLHKMSNNKVNFLYFGRNKHQTANASPTNNVPLINPATGLPNLPQSLQPSQTLPFPSLPPNQTLPPFPEGHLLFTPPSAPEAIPSPRVKVLNATLKNVTLKQVLDFSLLCFNEPMQYVVNDFGVIFIHMEKGKKVLFSRRFKVNPFIFRK